MKALDFLHTECFKGDLKHFIGQEGILIDEENIVIIMEKYAEYRVKEINSDLIKDIKYMMSDANYNSNYFYRKNDMGVCSAFGIMIDNLQSLLNKLK